MDVVYKLIICHLQVASSHCQTGHSLHLELACGFHFIDFGHHACLVDQQGREFASFIQACVQDAWDLLDQRL